MQITERHVTVQVGGRVTIDVPSLPEGTHVRVTIEPLEGERRGSLVDLIGAEEGAFKSVEEVNRYIAEEREGWPY